MATFGRLEIPDAEAQRLSDRELVERLVDNGCSRLTAERIVAVERGEGEATRARRRSLSRP
jgi:hypothetical protein